MLACYCLQGKQLASGVIGFLTCQSHYNVSGINRTPRARLLLRHPLAQRIPTEACECSVTLPGAWSNTPVANWKNTQTLNIILDDYKEIASYMFFLIIFGSTNL